MRNGPRLGLRLAAHGDHQYRSSQAASSARSSTGSRTSPGSAMPTARTRFRTALHFRMCRRPLDTPTSQGRAPDRRLGEVRRIDNDPMQGPSYPGLISQYTTDKAAVLIDPSEYKPDYQEGQKDKTNYFVWQEAPEQSATAPKKMRCSR